MVKKYAILFYALYIAIVISTLALSNRNPDRDLITENRKVAPFPKLMTDNHQLNQGIFVDLENWLDDNAGQRDSYVKLGHAAKYYLLNITSTSLGEKGRNGWFYYRGGNNLELPEGDYDLGDVNYLVEQQQKISDILERQGIHYVLMIIPSKATVYPEYIASDDYHVQTSAAEIFEQALITSSDVDVIGLKDDFLRLRNQRQLYLKMDSHWSPGGAYEGYTQLVHHLQKENLMDVSPCPVTIGHGYGGGDIINGMGLSDLISTDDPKAETTQVINPQGEPEDASSITAVYQDRNVFIERYRNTTVPDKKILLFGDSFTHVPSMNYSRYMTESCSEYLYISNYEIRQECIDEFKPDIVVVQISERDIHDLPETLTFTE